MVCGAYEAVSLGKPLILSDTDVLREYFDQGCVFTYNETVNIRDAILKMKNQIKINEHNIISLKKKLIIKWESYFCELCKVLKNFD
jgi:glycosyltransferase involved in cell wall biosynthesis